MLNKKLSKLLVLGLSVTLLAGCADIVAKPSGYDDDKILNIENLDKTGSEMNNMLKTIYDAMHDSSTLSTTTINLINEKLFTLYYGEYEKIDEVVNNYKTTNDITNIKTFINEHKAYQELDEKGDRIVTAEAEALEIKRVERAYNRIQNLISEKLVSAISGSDYKDLDGLFSEKLFALNIYKKLHKLSPEGSNEVTWDAFTAAYNFYEPVELLPNLELFDEDENKWTETQDGVNNIIHITGTTKKDGTYNASAFGYYKEYIYNDILPDIYQHMLSEYYLYTNEYSTLGSKYARKATYISLTPNTKDIYKTKHVDLINYFAKANIKNATNKDASDLHLLEKAWLGYDLTDSAVTDLLNNAGFTLKTVDVTIDGLPGLTDAETVASFTEKYNDILTNGKLAYYEGTLFGNVIEDFKEINPFDIANSSKNKENKFSGNNTHSYYDGLVKEIQSLRQKTYVTEGWGLKSDGFSGLDSSVKDRLMTINVATDLKENANNGSYASNYLNYIEGTGNYYLLPEKRLPGDETPFIFSSGTTKTIVQVEEAASVAKLSKKSSSDNKYDAVKAEDVAFEICNLLADNSTVKSNAMEFFLEESEILYHDDKILEYFKDNYPNLFEK